MCPVTFPTETPKYPLGKFHWLPVPSRREVFPFEMALHPGNIWRGKAGAQEGKRWWKVLKVGAKELNDLTHTHTHTFQVLGSMVKLIQNKISLVLMILKSMSNMGKGSLQVCLRILGCEE